MSTEYGFITSGPGIMRSVSTMQYGEPEINYFRVEGIAVLED